MYYIIKSLQDCDLSLITIKKPYEVSKDIHIYDITYAKKPLLIQTPICTIPYSYSLFDNNTFKIDIQLSTKEFLDTIASIHQYVLNKIECYRKEHLQNKSFIDYTKEINNEYRLRLRNSNISNIDVFDASNNVINVSALQTYDKVICLYQLQRVIVQKDLYMFGTCLCQIKRLSIGMNNIQRNCLIMNDTYATYNKMKQLGIPNAAIEQKMIMDGLNQSDIKEWYKNQPPITLVPLLPPPPPPPPPPKILSVQQMNKSITKTAFLKDIQSNNFTLRKVVHNNIGKKENTKYGYEAPSLQDILKARSNLKKVK